MSAAIVLSLFAGCTGDPASDGWPAPDDTGEGQPNNGGDDGGDGSPGDPGEPGEFDFHREAVRAEVISTVDGAVALLVYDAEDTEIGSLTVRPAEDDWVVVELEAAFPDGAALVVVTDGQVLSSDGSLSDYVLMQRAGHAVDLISPAQQSVFGCASRVALAVALCAPLAAGKTWGAATCAVGVIEAWCECAPEVGLKTGEECKDDD